MTVTKRELLLSIPIALLFISIIVISCFSISLSYTNANKKYNIAFVIQNKDLFNHCIKTNRGNAFAAVTLSNDGKELEHPDLKMNNLLYVKRVKEKYESHIETYTTTDNKGHTHVHTRTVWEWEYKSKDIKHVDGLYVNDNWVDYEMLDLGWYHNKIEVEGNLKKDNINGDKITHYRGKYAYSGIHERYYYIGVSLNELINEETKLASTQISFKDGGFEPWESSKFVFHKESPEELKETIIKNNNPILWYCLTVIFGILIMSLSIWVFIYLDNRWLEEPEEVNNV